MPKKRVGIVGCGAIGFSLAQALIKDFGKEVYLSALYDLDGEKAVRLCKKLHRNRALAAATLKELIKRADLVIEAASAKSSFDIAQAVLFSRKDIMVMSVGGIVAGFDSLRKLAVKHNCRIYIPSGAISGIDALKAASLNKIKSVTLTTTKNPGSFRGVKYVQDKKFKLDRINKDTVLFSGPASNAVKYFPQNINVAAVLSLAGLGVKKTRVKIIASPQVTRNVHEIRIESAAANIFTRTENILHPQNPKTSYLAVLSAIAALKRILDPVKIGT